MRLFREQLLRSLMVLLTQNLQHLTDLVDAMALVTHQNVVRPLP